MSSYCAHGRSLLCQECRKESQARDRAKVREGTHAYFVVPFREDGHYCVGDAVGHPYKTARGAQKRIDANRATTLPRGYVVRLLAHPLIPTQLSPLQQLEVLQDARSLPTPHSRVPGIVKWWNDSKGYGFISVEGGPEAGLFAHYTALEMDGFKTLAEGQAVTMRVLDGPKGPQAVEIRTAEVA